MKSLPTGIPKPPERLSQEAAGWWRAVLEEYDLAPAALLLLENALTALDRLREAQGVLQAEGLVTKDRWGQPKQHPATLVERDCKTVMLRNIQALGLDLEPLHDHPGRPPGK